MSTMIAQADEGLLLIDAYGEGGQHIGDVGMVFQRGMIGTAANTMMSACIPGRHEIDMSERMVIQRFSEDQLR